MLSIIGGSGLEKIGLPLKQEEISTPFGLVPIQTIQLEDTPVIFLSRHGKDHTIAPHQINYKANIWALHSLSVTHILATAAVGSLREDFPPGSFGIVSQFLDFTKSRNSTYFDHFKDGINHIDMTQPYSSWLNKKLETILIEKKLPHQKDLTLVVTEGPRFETSAEIKAYSILGGDIVGMTGYPEISLARELGIEYSCLAISTNFAAGIKEQKLSHEEVIHNIKLSFEKAKEVLISLTRSMKDMT